MKKILIPLMLSVLIGLSTSAQVPTNGLVGYWPFNGNANDASGNGHNSIINGATLTTDRFGNANSAYLFTNDGDYISCDTSTNTFGTINFTVSAWIYTTSNNDQYIVSSYGANSLLNGYIFMLQSDSLHIRLHNGHYPNGNAWATSQKSFNSNINQWHHVAASYNGSVLKLYTDGIVVANEFKTNTGSQIYNYYPRNMLYIGKPIWVNSSSFKGSIDEVRYYNRALDSTEISALYNENICIQSLTVTDTLKINVNLTGFNPISYKNNIKIYPNPTKDAITVDCGANYNTLSTYKIKITNNLGQSVYESLVTKQVSTINLNSWTGKGIYVIQLIDSNSNIIENKKIVLQ